MSSRSDSLKSAEQDLFSEAGTQANVPHSLENPNSSIPISTHAASAALKSIEKKPKFSEFLCDPWRVRQFVIRVVRDTIPRDFWGSTANAKAIEDRKLLKNDPLPVHPTLTGFLDVSQTLSPSCAFAGTSR